jgi:hypothetical protein
MAVDFNASGFKKITMGTYTSSTVNDPIYQKNADERGLESYVINSATSGDNRAQYFRMDFTGAGGGGDAGRFYAIAKAAVANIQGVHATAQLGAAGSVVGEVVGLRGTAATSTGLTLTAGSIYSIRADSDFTSAVTSMASAAFVGFFDVGAQKMPCAFDFSGCTSGASNAVYWKGSAITLSNLYGSIKVKLPTGGVCYIPAYNATGG